MIDGSPLEGEDSLFDVDIITEVSDEDPVSALTAGRTLRCLRVAFVCGQQYCCKHKAPPAGLMKLLGCP